jgi:hypothetical protein
MDDSDDEDEEDAEKSKEEEEDSPIATTVLCSLTPGKVSVVDVAVGCTS